MPPKPRGKKITKPSKKASSSSVSQSPKPTVVMKPVECFMRDVSFESHLPPSLYPKDKRDMDFHVAATVRPLTSDYSCVNVAIRVRLSPQGKAPFIILEMIQEGVFKATCENKEQAKVVYTQGGPYVYEKAREMALGILASHGVKPPFPETVDFEKMWQGSTK
ncbi:MAG: protein-export chaperone SecB [Alphaproteobacteria bacterium]